jgi:hypothetical protein
MRSVLASWRELGRKIAFFLLLIAGSAAAGAAIAWPLWFFATSARGVYTFFALLLACAGMVYLAARAIIRAARAPRNLSRRRRRPLTVFLGIVQVVVFVFGLYAAALLFAHRIWIFAVPVLVAWLGLLLLLGMARRAARA